MTTNATPPTRKKRSPIWIPSIFRLELPLWIGIVTVILCVIFEEIWFKNLSDSLGYYCLWVLIVGVMMWLSFGVIQHERLIGARVGEPYGTLTLTLVFTLIETALITLIILSGNKYLGLTRDTVFSILMIMINGVMGLSLIVGGLKYFEQVYNPRGIASYLLILGPLTGLSLVLPSLTKSAPSDEVSTLMASFIIIFSLTLYGVFLAIQTKRNQAYFQSLPIKDEVNISTHGGELEGDSHSLKYHILLLTLTLLPIFILAKYLSVLVSYATTKHGLPSALDALLIAMLVLTPKIIDALSGVWENELQRSINSVLGTSVAITALLIPAVLGISYFFTGHRVELGLNPVEITLLAITFFVLLIDLSDERANILQGIVHLLLFYTFIVFYFRLIKSDSFDWFAYYSIEINDDLKNSLAPPRLKANFIPYRLK